MIEIRPATADDIKAFAGAAHPRTVQALSVWRDDKLVAVAGVEIEWGRITAFCDAFPHNALRMTVWRVAKEIMKFISARDCPVIAIASPNHTNSQRFLEALGFKRVDQEQPLYRLERH